MGENVFIWALLVKHFPFVCDSLMQNFDMVTIVGTTAEVEFSISNRKRQEETYMEARISDMTQKG